MRLLSDHKPLTCEDAQVHVVFKYQIVNIVWFSYVLRNKIYLFTMTFSNCLMFLLQYTFIFYHLVDKPKFLEEHKRKEAERMAELQDKAEKERLGFQAS